MPCQEEEAAAAEVDSRTEVSVTRGCADEVISTVAHISGVMNEFDKNLNRPGD